MKALIYIVECVDSALDSIHGGGYPVVEIFVPKLKIAFNERKGMFATGTPRSDNSVDAEVPAKLAKRILQHVKEHGYLEGKLHKLFRDDRDKFSTAVIALKANYKKNLPPLPEFDTYIGT